MKSMSVSLAGVTFKNPVLLASGIVGFGREYGEYFSLNDVGGICVKGLTLHERQGNAPPRIAETPSGMLNAVGLQNPGVDAFIERELPYLRQFDTKIVANISGNTVDEYAELATRLGSAVDMLEVNISCPNVKLGGLAFGTDAASASDVTRAVKAVASVPVMVKLSPNVTDIAAIAKSVEAAGADALSLINTLLGMRIDIHTRRPVLHNNVGGLSGPAVLPVALRCVWQVSNAVSIPIVGMGGIATAADAIEMLLAGATAISVGTAMFGDPTAPVVIRDGIAEYFDARGIASVSELTGGVVAW